MSLHLPPEQLTSRMTAWISELRNGGLSQRENTPIIHSPGRPQYLFERKPIDIRPMQDTADMCTESFASESIPVIRQTDIGEKQRDAESHIIRSPFPFIRRDA